MKTVNPAIKINLLPYLALGAGILALSFSAMFVRWAQAPGPVTGFYRLLFSTLILTPFFVRRCAKDPAVNRSNLLFPILGGIFTACDLSLWNSSLAYTTAANATLLGNTAPLWVALGAWILFHERLKGNFWFGLVLALSGAALIMGGDFLTHPRLGIGDLMACGAGLFYASYFLSTERGRKSLDPLSYIWLVGLSASLSLLVINMILGFPLAGYPAQTWLIFLATALVSQIIGYTCVSYALGHLPAAVVSPTMIMQPVMTAILAIPLLGEVPRGLQVAGGIIALAGIYIVHQTHHRAGPPA